jgi:hypothetical protein
MTSPSAAVLKEAEALVERIFALASLSVAQQDTKDNKPPERVELTAAERAMVVYLRDPNQSIREIAHQVGCDPSLLYRDERLKRLREAHKGKVPKGTKSKEGDLEAEAED